MNIGFYVGRKSYITHGVVLANSIKKSNPKAVIHAVCHDSIDVESLEKLNELGVFIYPLTCDELLPFYDKIKAAALLESKLSDPFYWLDVDGYVIGKLQDLNAGLSINPVDIRNVGIIKGQPVDELWEAMMTLVDVDVDSYQVNTRYSNETILPYYNVGCVYTDNQHSLFSKTYEVLNQVLVSENYMEIINSTPLYQIFVHQVIFSLVAVKVYGFEKISSLPRGVNVSLHILSKEKLPWPKNVITFRYDTYFHDDIRVMDHHLEDELILNACKLYMDWYYE